jgi:hypothetical protein
MRARAARLEVRRHDWSASRAPESGGPGIAEVFTRNSTRTRIASRRIEVNFLSTYIGYAGNGTTVPVFRARSAAQTTR